MTMPDPDATTETACLVDIAGIAADRSRATSSATAAHPGTAVGSCISTSLARSAMSTSSKAATTWSFATTTTGTSSYRGITWRPSRSTGSRTSTIDVAPSRR